MLQKNYNFVLIGGWAVFLYTKSLKSKDIDIIVEPETLGLLKSHYDVFKNDRLKKYELKLEGFDVDIYLPHWSQLGIPAATVYENSILIEGFKVPKKEILFVLKLIAYQQRKGSLKGKKDELDILSLVNTPEVDFAAIKTLFKTPGLKNLEKEFIGLLNSRIDAKELGLHRKKYSDLKKTIFKSYGK